MNNELVVSGSPFIHSKNDINKMFMCIALGLVVPAIYGVVLFGVRALLVILVSVVVALASEVLFNLFNKKKFFLNNLSFLDTGLILALTLPVNVPIYVVAIVSFVAVFIVKMAFGGLGRNPFNPALTARCLAGVIVPGLAAELYGATVFGDDYVSLTAGGENTLANLIIGKGVGGIGTTFIIILLATFVVLAILKIIDAKIPILAIISYMGVSFIFTGLDGTMINLFSGSFIFVSVFMITDPNTSPNSLLGKVVYSVAFGALSALLWHFGYLGENTVFVVALFVNFFVPFMDKYFVLRPVSIGGYRNARKN